MHQIAIDTANAQALAMIPESCGAVTVGCTDVAGVVEAVTEVAGCTAIIPSIEGWAHVYGYNQIRIDDADPYAAGFLVR